MGISERDFEFISDLVRKESAISLEKGKEYLVESRLGPIATKDGFESIVELVEKLRSNTNLLLKRKVVEAMTTNETSFFRDIEPFDMLREEILPEVIERKKIERKLTIWSAAASTGQEIYSLCLLIKEHFPEILSWDLKLIGTDISTETLEKAKNGKYTQLEVNRGLPATMLVKYFKREGTDWQISKEIRDMVELRELNLIQPWIGIPVFDIIFIRNVLIYFDVDVKKQILAKMQKHMYPHSKLFLGAAETTLNIDSSFIRRTYKRGGCYEIAQEK